MSDLAEQQRTRWRRGATIRWRNGRFPLCVGTVVLHHPAVTDRILVRNTYTGREYWIATDRILVTP